VTVAIADGVSTSVDPHKASAAAVRAAVQVLVGAANPDDELLDMAVTEASAAVADVTDPAFLDGDGNAHRGVSVPACTLVAAHVLGAQITVVSVGDSRAYWIPEQGDAEQLSVEDSWAAAAILGGAPPDVVYADRRSHQITAWIGIDAGPLSPHITRRAVTGPGTVIICSDGLWTYLPNLLEFAELVRRHLAAAGRVALNAARSLTEFARSAGGHDNITVAVLTIPGR
jgi:serine/threonine protein phosphatase PrpC